MRADWRSSESEAQPPESMDEVELMCGDTCPCCRWLYAMMINKIDYAGFGWLTSSFNNERIAEMIVKYII